MVMAQVADLQPEVGAVGVEQRRELVEQVQLQLIAREQHNLRMGG